ncbi:hypothetical protein EDB81DRAFT_880427 [Dactylonectria macrodidyma]|uniref:Arca-like protein n=1 Tax=Dactylonectria macrodidyma TaxID=307937 RepID=A0A9P9F9A4_9HYPO|nr:hypothetical protein EDB81DRAFT_880427 [Dactylonectria macrodidyma]
MSQRHAELILSESELEDDATSPPEHERTGTLPANPYDSPSLYQTYPASTSTDLEPQSIIESTSIEPFSPIPRLGAYAWIPSDDGHLEKETPGLVPSVSAPNGQQPLYRDVSMWPLTNANEANLIRHYIENVSRIFDLCDRERHFSQVVPWRAATCPPLMDAVLALSARWLSRTTDFDEYVADRYQQRCLNSMVPMLGDPDALLNEDLFAAIVILRTLEEIEAAIFAQLKYDLALSLIVFTSKTASNFTDAVPLSGADSGTHLFGNHLFVSASATGQSPSSGSQAASELSGLTGLRRAAFLVAFRQEVFTAFVSQRPVTPVFCPQDIDRSVDVPADDCTWCHRILLHLADALAFCFPDSSITTDESVKKYEELVAYGDHWYLKKPQSFNPIYFKASSSNKPDETIKEQALSPDVWLLSDTVATGLLNYHLSRILLLAFDPRTPRLGPSRIQFLKRQNQEIKQEVKTVVGVANGNAQCGPNVVLGCAGVALAGDRFETRWEQEELIRFLKKAEALYAWSTSAAQQHLMEAWSWMETDV